MQVLKEVGKKVKNIIDHSLKRQKSEEGDRKINRKAWKRKQKEMQIQADMKSIEENIKFTVIAKQNPFAQFMESSSDSEQVQIAPKNYKLEKQMPKSEAFFERMPPIQIKYYQEQPKKYDNGKKRKKGDKSYIDKREIKKEQKYQQVHKSKKNMTKEEKYRLRQEKKQLREIEILQRASQMKKSKEQKFQASLLRLKEQDEVRRNKKQLKYQEKKQKIVKRRQDRLKQQKKIQANESFFKEIIPADQPQVNKVDKLECEVKKEKQVPEYLLCPITYTLMTSPMILASCGHTFEEKTIRQWLLKQSKCPLCNKETQDSLLVKNFALAEVCSNFK